MVWKTYDIPCPEVEVWMSDPAVKRFLNIDCFWDYYCAIIGGANDIYDEHGDLELAYEPGKNYFVYLIYDGNAPVGLIELYNPLCICTIIVAPEHRNKGIGTTILQELIADPPKYVPFPTKEISAVIDNENFASIQTFQKAGFSIRNAIDDTCKAYVLKL